MKIEYITVYELAHPLSVKMADENGRETNKKIKLAQGTLFIETIIEGQAYDEHVASLINLASGKMFEFSRPHIGEYFNQIHIKTPIVENEL